VEHFCLVGYCYKKRGKAPSPDISAICSKWKDLFDKTPDKKGSHYIDTFMSYRRHYGVRALVFSGSPSLVQNDEKQYLFILERINYSNINFSRIVRQWNLRSRDQQIAQLLLEGRSNKEIACSLNLSIHTIKGYMKLLMSRLNVCSRTEIISTLLKGKSGI